MGGALVLAFRRLFVLGAYIMPSIISGMDKVAASDTNPPLFVVNRSQADSL